MAQTFILLLRDYSFIILCFNLPFYSGPPLLTRGLCGCHLQRICSSRYDLLHAQFIMANEQICKLHDQICKQHDKLLFSAGSFPSVLIFSSSVPRLSPLALLLLQYSLPLSPPHHSPFSLCVALAADLLR